MMATMAPTPAREMTTPTATRANESRAVAFQRLGPMTSSRAPAGSCMQKATMS